MFQKAWRVAQSVQLAPATTVVPSIATRARRSGRTKPRVKEARVRRLPWDARAGSDAARAPGGQLAAAASARSYLRTSLRGRAWAYTEAAVPCSCSSATNLGTARATTNWRAASRLTACKYKRSAPETAKYRSTCSCTAPGLKLLRQPPSSSARQTVVFPYTQIHRTA